MKKYKHNRKLITIKCDNCGQDYNKPISEYNRNKKFNRHSFCSRSCSAIFNSKNRKNRNIKFDHLLEYNKNKKSNSFLYYMRSVRQRFKEYNITIDDLKNQWLVQNEMCVYSGIRLQLASYTTTDINPIYRASLDRIDSNKGYIKGNIQFVSTSINYMKNKLSHDETIELCKLISKNYA